MLKMLTAIQAPYFHQLPRNKVQPWQNISQYFYSIIPLSHISINLILLRISLSTHIFYNSPTPTLHNLCYLYSPTDLTLTLSINQMSIPSGPKLGQHTALLFRFTSSICFRHSFGVCWLIAIVCSVQRVHSFLKVESKKKRCKKTS